jgi:hypothetical protein
MGEFSDLEDNGFNFANMNEIDFSSKNMIIPLEENETKSVNNDNVVNININIRKNFAEDLEYDPDFESYLNKPLFYNNNNKNIDENEINCNIKEISKAKKLKIFLEICKKYKLSHMNEIKNLSNEKINQNNSSLKNRSNLITQKNDNDTNVNIIEEKNKKDINNYNKNDNNIFTSKNILYFFYKNLKLFRFL